MLSALRNNDKGKVSYIQSTHKHKTNYAVQQGVVERDCGSVGSTELQQCAYASCVCELSKVLSSLHIQGLPYRNIMGLQFS